MIEFGPLIGTKQIKQRVANELPAVDARRSQNQASRGGKIVQARLNSAQHGVRDPRRDAGNDDSWFR